MVLIPYITTYSCVRLCSGVYFFSVVELVFTTLDILASLCSAVDEHCQIEPTRRVIMISPVAVLPNTLHSYAVMCSCCSRILCIQPTNSITLKGSMRDKVPSLSHSRLSPRRLLPSPLMPSDEQPLEAHPADCTG